MHIHIYVYLCVCVILGKGSEVLGRKFFIAAIVCN